MNDVAVLDDVVFALKSEFASLFTLRLTAQNNKVIVSNHLGTDKSTLDVTMNLSCSLARDRSLSDRPGADLVFARRKKAYQIQQPVRRPDKSLPGRFFDANLLQKCFAIAFIQLRDLHLDLSRQSQTVQSAPLQFILVSRRQGLTGFIVSLIKKHQNRLATKKPEA